MGYVKYVLIVAVLAILACMLNMGTDKDAKEGAFILIPPFTAEAAETNTFPEDEAGISAYTNVGQNIDLDDVKSVYRTIEYECDEYIIGSVEISGYGETEDVHVYVSKDGWILAYYLKDDPAAKIIDWLDYSEGKISTKLEKALAKVCDAVGLPLLDVKYYDFRYPNANRLMIVADYIDCGEDTFRIKIPSDFAVYEASWSFREIDPYCTNWLKIDEKELIKNPGCGKDYYGKLSSTQLEPDVFHIVSVGSGYGGLVLIYKEG